MIGWLAYIVKHLGQTKERKTALTIGFGIVMMKSLETLRMHYQARRLGCSWPGLKLGPEQGGGRGASNKYSFRKVSQLCICKDSRVQNACTSARICKYAFAEILTDSLG